MEKDRDEEPKKSEEDKAGSHCQPTTMDWADEMMLET